MFSFKYSSMSARNQYSTQTFIAQIAVVCLFKNWTIDASCAGYENFRARVSENRWTSGCPGGCDWRGVLLEPRFFWCFSLFFSLDTCQQKTIKDYIFICVCCINCYFATMNSSIFVSWRFSCWNGDSCFMKAFVSKLSDAESFWCFTGVPIFFALLCFFCLCFFGGQEMTQPNFLHSWSYVEAGRQVLTVSTFGARFELNLVPCFFVFWETTKMIWAYIAFRFSGFNHVFKG